jgi:gliding motility-associated-like protein
VLTVDVGVLNFDDISVCTDEMVTVSIDDFEDQFPDADLIVDDGTGSPENFTGDYATEYDAPGVYEITVSGTIQGCLVSESFDVLVENSVTSFLEDEYQFCSGQSLELNFENLDYEVFDSDGNLITSAVIQESGTFIFIGENGCSEFTQVIDVTAVPFNPDPLPLFQTICPGSDTADIGFSNNDYIYQWENGSEDSLISVLDGGIYEVFVSDLSEQCSQNYLFQVSETPYQPVNIFEFPQIDICLEGQNAVTFPFQYAPYTTPEGMEIPLSYEAEESEMLYFSYSDECYTYSDSVFVSVESCLCPVFVPNVFTPNEDGLNDLFRAEVDCPIYDYKMIIFNRWGREIFESIDIDIPWRGESPRDDYYAHDGVYLYLIRFSQEVDGLRYPTELTGTVTLLR